MTNPSYSDSIWNPVTEINDLYEDKDHVGEYDLLVFVGRFQPLHLGHQRVIDIALQKSRRVLVLVGSSWSPRRPRNPFTFEERRKMIRTAYSNVPESKLLIEPLMDFTYRDEMWVSEVQHLAKEAARDIKEPKIGLIGCSKDASSYYLNLFPQWGSVKVRFLNPLNATDIRSNIFYFPTSPELWTTVNNAIVIDPAVTKVVSEIIAKPEFTAVHQYHKACMSYHNKRQAGQEYPVQELCADALVTQSGHVLLQQRGGRIGYGLWALPGGHVEENETLLECALRELKEEVKIKVPIPVLKGSVVDKFDADSPTRSERGRVYSKVFHFKLADRQDLPEVRPGNLIEDGRKEVLDVRWWPLADLDPEVMFEDHFHLISAMLKL